MGRFAYFVAASIALHLFGILGAVTLWQQQDIAATALSKQPSVSLGLLTAMAGSVTTPAVAASKQITSAKETPIEPKQTPVKQQPLSPKKPLPEPKQKPKPQKADKAAPPKMEQQKQRETEPPKLKSTNAQLAQKQRAQGKQGSSNQPVQQAETGIAKQQGGGNIDQQYDLLVRRHLLSFKTPPKRLSLRNAKAELTLSFSLDRNGQVLQQHVDVNLGRRGFRHEVLAMLRRAEPFPKPPAETRWQRRDYQLDINYQLH